MANIVARKIIENGEEIIELDLNKPWPAKKDDSYKNYMDQVDRLYAHEEKSNKIKKDFITIIN